MKKIAALDKVDELLARIGQLTARRRQLEDMAEAEIARVRTRFGEIQELDDRIGQMDKEVKKMLKAKGGEVYQGKDKVNLNHGIIYHAIDQKVTIPKGALALIREHGWTDAVRVTEAVKREVVETWPEERLESIGTRRRDVHRYDYELSD